MTWIEEDGTLLGGGGGVFDDGKACGSGGCVMIVHRNLEGSALQASFGGIDSKTLAVAPRKLQGVGKVRRGGDTRRKLTDVSRRGAGEGPAATRSVSGLRASRAARTARRNIWLVGELPIPLICIYMRCVDFMHSRSDECIT